MRGVTIPAGATAQVFVQFQSTLPMRGVTIESNEAQARYEISIHTPHAGSDQTKTVAFGVLFNFNPHSPCGE